MTVSDLPVLMYHSVASVPGSLHDLGVNPESLGEHLSALTDAGYALVGLTEAVNLRLSGDKSRLAALTFDDGYETFAAALPQLAALGARATLYICPRFVGGFADWLGRYSHVMGPLMDWAGLREVSCYGVEIGNHSFDHIPLDILPTSELMQQLQQSGEAITENLGQYPQSFCYPHGYQSARTRKAVSGVGYKNACVIGHRVADLADVFSITRLMVLPGYSGARLVQLLSARRSWKSKARAAAYPPWRIARQAGYRYMGRVYT